MYSKLLAPEYGYCKSKQEELDNACLCTVPVDCYASGGASDVLINKC